MKLHLNLSTKPQENRRPFVVTASVIGTVGLIALVVLSEAAYHSWQANRTVRAQISNLEEQVRESSAKQAQLAAYFRTPGVQKTLDRAAFLHGLITERSFPWTKIFVTLEETIPAGVRVV